MEARLISLGFTGTADGMTDQQKEKLAIVLKALIAEGSIGGDPEMGCYLIFHHGDCIGADAEAHEILGKMAHHKFVVHPPLDPKSQAFVYRGTHWIHDFDEYRSPKAYLERNHDIVDESERLIATPKTAQEQLRSGTWATVRYARKMGKMILLILPDGEMVIDGPRPSGYVEM